MNIGYPPTSPSSPKPSRLQQVDSLLQNDRQRKLLLALPLAGVVGAAVALQCPWALALLATGMLGAQALHHRR